VWGGGDDCRPKGSQKKRRGPSYGRLENSSVRGSWEKRVYGVKAGVTLRGRGEASLRRTAVELRGKKIRNVVGMPT